MRRSNGPALDASVLHSFYKLYTELIVLSLPALLIACLLPFRLSESLLTSEEEEVVQMLNRTAKMQKQTAKLHPNSAAFK